MPDADRLRLAVELSGRSHDEPLDGAALNRAWKSLGEFLGHETPYESLGIEVVGSGATAEAARQRLDDYRRAVVRECADSARQLIGQRLREGFATVTAEGVTIVAEPGRPLAFRTAGRPEAFRLTLAYLLSTQAGTRVLECPICSRIFVRVGRQLTCSDSCTDRKNWREYPAAKKKRARARYYEQHGWTLGARTRKVAKKS